MTELSVPMPEMMPSMKWSVTRELPIPIFEPIPIPPYVMNPIADTTFESTPIPILPTNDTTDSPIPIISAHIYLL